MALKAVIIRCPNCNAILEIASTVTSVKCSYCDVVSRIQAKTMMFQVPPSLPQQPVQRAAQLQHLQHLTPVRPNHNLTLMFVVMGIVMFGSVMSFVFSTVRSQSRVAAAYKETAKSSMGWGGQRPVLVDANGDGVRDIVGVARFVSDGDRVNLAAFSGTDGKMLWQSPSLGAFGSLSQSRFARLGTQILVATESGVVTAYDGTTGTQAWRTPLDEKISVFCAAGDAAVVVETADDKWTRLDDKGARSPASPLIRFDSYYSNDDARKKFDAVAAEATEVCVPVGDSWNEPGDLLSLQRWHDLAKIDGMSIERLVRRPGSADTIAVGAKDPGTSVPMLAKLTGKRAAWTAVIPAQDPLTASFEQKNLALSDRAVFVLYTTGGSDSVRLTAFEIATGKRLWDRSIPSGNGFVPVGLSWSGDTVMLSTWQQLTAYSVTDGSDRFTIGSR